MNALQLVLICLVGWLNRNLTDGLGGFLAGSRYWIHDRSSLFTPEFGMILKSAGIETVRLPARSPNLNAYAERYVRTIREGYLDRMILIGEGPSRRAIREFVVHYHTEKNHQGLENKIIQPEVAEFPSAGAINCRERLGGMLRYYYRAAA
ncbi:MAG TPA: integrase core domain-containing protein [Candidatus Paceibacterota bacterium]|nr:integrase core domain-containing protein [Candidatus Paceibacterota bacterium]